MLEILFTVGLPGSGKSTWSENFIREKQLDKQKWKRISRDLLREMFDYYTLSTANEKFVTQVYELLLSKLVEEEYNILVDDTNLNKDHRQFLMNKLPPNKYEVKFQSFLEVPLEECLKRNDKREGFKKVPPVVIRNMHKKYIEPKLTGI